MPRQTIRRSGKNLGRTQILVLNLLSLHNDLSASELEYHWPSLTRSSAHSALMRLGDRALVDVANWSPDKGRTYKLTEAGRAVAAELVPLDDEEGC